MDSIDEKAADEILLVAQLARKIWQEHGGRSGRDRREFLQLITGPTGPTEAADVANTVGASCGGQPIGRGAQEIDLSNVDEAMTYQPMDPYQVDQANQVREALTVAAKAILRVCPRSPRRTLALQHVISARMDANAAISFRGRF